MVFQNKKIKYNRKNTYFIKIKSNIYNIKKQNRINFENSVIVKSHDAPSKPT